MVRRSHPTSSVPYARQSASSSVTATTEGNPRHRPRLGPRRVTPVGHGFAHSTWDFGSAKPSVVAGGFVLGVPLDVGEIPAERTPRLLEARPKHPQSVHQHTRWPADRPPN